MSCPSAPAAPELWRLAPALPASGLARSTRAGLRPLLVRPVEPHVRRHEIEDHHVQGSLAFLAAGRYELLALRHADEVASPRCADPRRHLLLFLLDLLPDVDRKSCLFI